MTDLLDIKWFCIEYLFFPFIGLYYMKLLLISLR